MNAESVIEHLIDALNASGIDYVIVGSLASSFYGLSRSTQDADVVIAFHSDQLHELIQLLSPRFERDPQLAFETVTGTTKTVLQDRESQFQIEVFYLSEDPHDQERFARRRLANIFDRHAYLLAPEDVVVTKLRWAHLAGRPKDVTDVQTVIRIQGDTLDWPYIERWAERHETQPLLARIRDELDMI